MKLADEIAQQIVDGDVPLIPMVERIRELEAQKDGAYSERDQLVALVSKSHTAWLERHPDEDKDWEDDWRWIVFINLPTGQASWHIHDSELHLFDHLERNLMHSKSWDGHTTEEKYKRVEAVQDVANRPTIV